MSNENNSEICSECKYPKNCMLKFKCNHSICKECLCLLIIENEFLYKDNKSEFKLLCSQCDTEDDEKILIINFDVLKKLFISSNDKDFILNCQKHSKKFSYYCESCDLELCEDCKINDSEHETSQIEIEDYKSDEIEKNILNKNLKLEEIKNYIKECREKLMSENDKQLSKIRNEINESMKKLNDFLVSIEKKIENNNIYINNLLDLISYTYEKFFSMMNISQISFEDIRKISKMKTLLEIKAYQPLDIIQSMTSLNNYINQTYEKIKDFSPMKINLKYKEGITQTNNCYTFNTELKEFMTGAILINNNNNLITSSTDKSLYFFQSKLENNEITSFELIKKEIDDNLIVTSLLNLNSNYFVAGYNDGSIKLWRIEDFEIDKLFIGHTNQIRKMIKQNESLILSCSDDMTIKGWSIDSVESDCSFTLTGHEDIINDFSLIDDVLISVSNDKSIRLWNLETKENDNFIKTKDILLCIAKIKSGFMVGGEDGTITIFNLEGLTPILCFKAHESPIEILFESPFNGDIIIGSQDSLIKIFNGKNYKECLKVLKGHKNTLLNIIQINENKIFSSSVDKTIKIWNI